MLEPPGSHGYAVFENTCSIPPGTRVYVSNTEYVTSYVVRRELMSGVQYTGTRVRQEPVCTYYIYIPYVSGTESMYCLPRIRNRQKPFCTVLTICKFIRTRYILGTGRDPYVHTVYYLICIALVTESTCTTYILEIRNRQEPT